MENINSVLRENESASQQAETEDLAPAPQASESGNDSQQEHVSRQGKNSPSKKGKKSGGAKKKRKPVSTRQMLVKLLIKVGVIALAVWLTLTFVLGVTVHYGNNMHPAVRDGDLIITLRLQRPYINAAVMYEHDGETDIGRVIGLPGNEINISEKGEITVNGIIPSEEVFYATYAAENSGISYPYTVPEDCVFILNDFRNDTNDSRSFGAVPMSDLDGPILLSIRRRGF